MNAITVEPPFRYLFLGNGNDVRTPIAEALLLARSEDRFVVSSAGIEPSTRIHPMARSVLEDAGLECPPVPRSLSEVLDEPWDVVIGICDRDRSSRPTPLRPRVTAYWGIDDPTEVDGDEETVRLAFRRMLHYLGRRIDLMTALPLPKQAWFVHKARAARAAER